MRKGKECYYHIYNSQGQFFLESSVEDPDPAYSPPLRIRTLC
jgi:hypothetical protein